MKTLPITTLLACASFLWAQAPIERPPGKPIDLAICLDISGSMDGLLNAARQNLWAVVNELATLKPAPSLRVALLTYGCQAHDAARGWVKVESAFTTDLDLISEKLFALKTNGGEEYVGRVLQAALAELQWSTERSALELIFVAGNEPADQDKSVDFRAQCKAAIARGIVVNSIFCGPPTHADAAGWREVATLADGKFATIDQDKGTVVATPFDGQLVELSAAINKTYLPYGRAGATMAANQAAQDSNASGLNSGAAAARCQTKGCELYWNAAWDLVDACQDAKFKLEEVKPEELPEALRAMTPEQRRASIAENAKKRGEIKAQIEAVGKQRDGYVQKELAKQQADRTGHFEQVVLEAVRCQAEAKGFTREKPARATEGAQKARAAESRPRAERAFDEEIANAAREYRSYTLVSGQAKMAPTDCRMPVAAALVSRAESAHGAKLYLLYANVTKSTQYVEAGKEAPVGQTLVKESWVAEEGQPTQQTEAGKRYLRAPVAEKDGKQFHAGASAGLFVMRKLATDTPGTDRGWIYGTVDRDGKVTASGKVASCIGCHERTTEDRRFGLR